MVQKSKQMELPFTKRGEASRKERSGQATPATPGTERPGTSALLEEALMRPNMQRALKRVKKNKGKPGIDGMTVEELPDWLRQHWLRIREELLAGTYQPQPVKRVVIPKAGGGERELGIPTVLDRLIQQALLQVLQSRFDPTFSRHSHGFRPGRRAHDAIREACRHVDDGKSWVVDVDLEKFFDRINHDVLMGRLAKRIADRRVLRLIRRYLGAGILADGVAMERHEGTPQGGPLSPLLANVLLDEVDKDLEKRGHAFVRYADDLRVFVGSQRAGQRVMHSLTRFFDKLRLRVNETKSAVAPVHERPFLGFQMRTWKERCRPVIAPKALKTMKDRVRALTRRIRGRSLQTVINDLRSYLTGWHNYFRIAQVPDLRTKLDSWIRRRLRAYQLKQWMRYRTTKRELLARGLTKDQAHRRAYWAQSSWWRNANHPDTRRALPNYYFFDMGLPRLSS